MKLSAIFRPSKTGISIAALALAFLAIWRMPLALGLSTDSLLLAGNAISIALIAALFLLFRHAFSCNDVRLKRISYGIGMIFSILTVIGKPLEATGKFVPVTFGIALNGLLNFILFSLVYGSALLLIYQGAQSIAKAAPNENKESLFSRISGNGFVVFALLMVCWVPVWLAFWPGTFGADSFTQFYTYLDGTLDTHHPLLHTLFLGVCMMFGIDHYIDNGAAIGLAIYSVMQMALLAAMLAYACHWLRRKSAPLTARVLITLLFALFPFYSLWSFSAQKDILFGGLVLVFILQLIDLWQDGFALLRSPLRISSFLLTSVLMLLMRNNGLYALLLLFPFAVLWAKGARLRMSALLAGCIALYFLANNALIWATDATSPCKIEFLSIPLQQIARTLRDNPEALSEDKEQVLDTLYGCDPSVYYAPEIADPVKWGADYDFVDESIPDLLSLWARLGVKYPTSYLEAFLVQNLPYYLPGSEMIYRFDLGITQIDIYPIEEYSYFTNLRRVYEEYDQTLTLFGLPGVRLLSDTAFYCWLCIAGFGYAIYLRQKKWMVGFAFLLGIWISCLVGPVAIIRYMLSLFYTVPVLLAAMLSPKNEQKALSMANSQTIQAPSIPALEKKSA